jgi:hypothetical protein
MSRVVTATVEIHDVKVFVLTPANSAEGAAHAGGEQGRGGAARCGVSSVLERSRDSGATVAAQMGGDRAVNEASAGGAPGGAGFVAGRVL